MIVNKVVTTENLTRFKRDYSHFPRFFGKNNRQTLLYSIEGTYAPSQAKINEEAFKIFNFLT